MINNIFDSHAHYNDAKFNDSRDVLLRYLPSRGIDKVINVASNIKESYESIKLADEYDYIYSSVGVHPHESKDVASDYIDQLELIYLKEKVIAIGEIGLYYHYNFLTKEIQQKVFKDQLSLAADLKAPIIIHSREADQDTIDILKKFKLKGVVHCFSSSVEVAEIFLKMGYYISFTGVITFKNVIKQIKSIEIVSIDRILVETDCPYMAPEPYRGKICDSSMLPFIIDKIAQIKHEDPQKIADITNKNACNLFNIN